MRGGYVIFDVFRQIVVGSVGCSKESERGVFRCLHAGLYDYGELTRMRSVKCHTVTNSIGTIRRTAPLCTRPCRKRS